MKLPGNVLIFSISYTLAWSTTSGPVSMLHLIMRLGCGPFWARIKVLKLPLENCHHPDLTQVLTAALYHWAIIP